MREGLHEAEAGLLGMLARFGSTSGLLDALDAPSRRALTRSLDALDALDEASKASLLSAWRERDRHEDSLEAAIDASSKRRVARAIHDLDARWVQVAERALDDAKALQLRDPGVALEAGALALEPLLDGPHRVRAELSRPRRGAGFDIGWFLTMDATSVGTMCRRIGVHQLAEHVRARPPRARALWSRSLPSDLEREWFRRDLASTARVVSSPERRRIELVVLRAQTTHPNAEEWLFHVGLNFAVLAHGRRAEQRIGRLVQRWPEPIKSALVEYAEQALRVLGSEGGRADADATALALDALAERLFDDGLVRAPLEDAR